MKNKETTLDQKLVEEGRIKPKKTPKVTKQLIVGLAPAFFEQIKKYIKSQPYEEVKGFFPGLDEIKPFEITITDGTESKEAGS